MSVQLVSMILGLVVWSDLIVIGQSTKWRLQCDACMITNDQWVLIAWYFKRAPFVEITEIVNAAPDGGNPSQFGNDIAKVMPWCIEKLIKTQTVDYLTEEAKVTNTQTYGWHAVHYESRSNLSIASEPFSVYVERDTADKIKRRTKMLNRTREDSPLFGSLVIADTVNVIDEYLLGYPRRPFKYPRVNFVILIYKNDSSTLWNSVAAKVLTKLWKMYGVLNAIIISTCNPSEVGYFDPFVNMSAVDKMKHDSWGIFRWIPIELIDLNDDWLLRKEESLNGYPITATIFTRFPTAVKTTDLPKVFLGTHYANGVKYSNGIGGSDGLVLGNMAEALNFDAITITPNGSTYGSLQPNRIYSGTIGDVLYGRADISFNGRFIQEYDSDEVEFLFSVSADKMCVIAPAAERVPQWMAIFKCFNVYVWILLPVVTCLCGSFWFMLKMWAYKKRRFTGEHEKMGFYDVIVEAWIIMLGASTQLPSRTMERTFVGSILMANVIIIGTFQGSLTTSFSTVSYYKNFETLSELDKSGLPIITSSQSLRTLFGNKDDATPLLKSLIRKFKIQEVPSPLNRTARKRDMCSVERYSDIHIIIKTAYQRPDGSAYLHTVDECPRHYFLAYMVKKGWSLLPRFNYMLSKFSEAGLLSVWYQQVENAFVVHQLISNRFDSLQTQAFTFHDIQTAFYILGIGLLAGCVLFFIEVFIMPPKDRHCKRSK